MVNLTTFISILVVTPILVIGIIFLQIFFAKKKSNWLGLILPIGTFLYSIYFLVADVLNGQNNRLENFLSLTVTFIACNIPTFILTVIYFVYRKKRKTMTDINKMNIQDL